MSVTASSTLSLAPPSLRLGTRATNALNSVFLFNLIDDAVGDLLCLQTCTHGTSPRCYNDIMKVGTDPNCGGKGGESAFYDAFGVNREHGVDIEGKESGWNCKKRFFVFLPDCPEPIKRWQPRVYSIVACIGERCSSEQNSWGKARGIAAGLIEGFFSPVLKFRFQPNDPIKFTWDKTFHREKQIAGFTEQPIDADHIGLYGSISQGANQEWIGRIKDNPAQFAKGLLKLVAVIAIVALSFFAVAHYPLASTLLAAYILTKSVQVIGQVFVPLLYNQNKP